MSRRKQLGLDLRLRPAFEREDFVEAPSNAVAVAKIDGWARWPGGKLLLTGPEGAGKSHLAAVWSTATGAAIVAAEDVLPSTGTGPVAVEDVDRVAGDTGCEEALFHLFNRTGAAGTPVLFTARQAPAHAGFALPDLQSRLSALDMAALALPDDDLLAAVIAKHASERQLTVADRVLDYILLRMDRVIRRRRSGGRGPEPGLPRRATCRDSAACAGGPRIAWRCVTKSRRGGGRRTE